MKTTFAIGTILRVKPKFVLKSGNFIEPTTKFVMVISITKAGTPQVIPLEGDIEPILPVEQIKNNYYKNMHWSKEGWKVYGHNTEIYK